MLSRLSFSFKPMRNNNYSIGKILSLHYYSIMHHYNKAFRNLGLPFFYLFFHCYLDYYFIAFLIYLVFEKCANLE